MGTAIKKFGGGYFCVMMLGVLPGISVAEMASGAELGVGAPIAAPAAEPTLTPTAGSPKGETLSSAPAREAAHLPLSNASPSAAAAAPDAAHLLQTSLSSALQAAPGGLADENLFPHYPALKVPVDFWTRVFAEWSENQSVLHDSDDLSRIYAVLDFREQAAALNPVALSLLKTREENEARETTRDLLKEVDRLQATPEKLSPDQRRVYDLFANDKDPARFKNALDSLRIQRGLRERTRHALEVSGRYMPHMESIFASYDLPRVLTRLPLMESSFNLEAYSKAGAAGVWQFIPSSARIYMRLNEVVDERRDPWFSTDAAARHLKDDYDALRDWPLAVTAYNYGRSGLLRALAEVNGTTLLDIIQRFQGRRFGFASRNYYAEFLAASDVERDWRKHFGDLQRDAPVPFELVETRDYLRYDTVRRLCGLDAQTFRTFNPAFREEVIDGKLYVPPAQPIRVPQGAAERFRLAYAELPENERFDRQRLMYASYRVKRGDSASRLARRYGISVNTLLALNGLKNAHKVRAGQTLKLPIGSTPDEDQTVLAQAEPAAHTAHAVKVSTRAEAVQRRHAAHTHRVEAGQTLGGIAQRYQTSIKRLRRLNGLRGDHLRVGAVLKLP